MSSTVVAAAASSQCLWPLEYQHPAAPASAPAPPLFTHFLFSVVLKQKKKGFCSFGGKKERNRKILEKFPNISETNLKKREEERRREREKAAEQHGAG